MRVGGFILVGGESSRMGRDKARLRFQSRLLVEHVAAQLMPFVDQVVLIGHPERYRDLNLQCLPDSRPNMGPLAGIETALLSRRAEWNIITACDMPAIETHWLVRLLDVARRTAAVCVVARDAAGVVQPLCAIYRDVCLPYVRAALDSR